MAVDIGLTYSSNPSRLIQQSGEFLSNNIRDIGKQVQSTILEINTRKDLARFAQNLQQNVNPNSDNFATQAVQVAANHPLAVQDPRGQIALNILGKAHGQYQQAKLTMDRLNKPMNVPGVGLVDPSTNKVLQPTPTKGVSVYGVGLVDPVTGDTITPEGERKSTGAAAGPKTLAPGAILVDPAGKTIATNPKQAASQTPAQQLMQRRIQLQETEDGIKLMQRDLQALRGQYKDAEKMEYSTKEAKQDAESKAFFDQKIKIGQMADELEKQIKERQAQRDKLVTDLGSQGQSESPESIREAYRKGTITREQAKEALTKLMSQ